MDHQFSSPIYRSDMVAESHFSAHQEDERDVKFTSASTRSPTTVFAVDDLTSVFRMPDDAIERGIAMDHQEQDAGSNSLHRCLTLPSFTTDGELSTFSEDKEGDEEASDDENDHPSRFTLRSRRRAPLSIFRPVSGKRQYEHEQHVNTLDTPTKRRTCSAPLLCRANSVGSDDGCDEIPFLSSAYSFASPVKRVCHSSSSSTSSSFTSLFAEAMPATIRSNEADTFSITPQHLQHPLLFESLPISRATNIMKIDDTKEDSNK